MHPRGGRGVRVERKSWGLASSRVRHPIVVPLPLRHTRGRSSSERNTLSKTLRFVIDRVTQPSPFEKSNSQVEAGFSVRQPLCRHGVQIPLTQQHIVLAADFYFSSIGGVEEHPIVYLYRADMSADGDYCTPDKTPSDRHSGGNQDSRAALPLPLLSLRRHENPIIQHSDRQRLRIGHALASLRKSPRAAHQRPHNQQEGDETGRSSAGDR